MPLQLHYLPDAHFAKFIEITGNSFHEAADPCHITCFPIGPTPEGRKIWEKNHRASAQKRGGMCVAIYDVPDGLASPPGELSREPTPNPETMVGGARLRLEDPITLSEPVHKRETPPNAHPEAFRDFFDLIGPARDVMGVSTFLVLEMIAIDTKCQGRGAGRVIMDWMVKTMRETRVEVASVDEKSVGAKGYSKQEVGDVGIGGFLEAFKAGKKLYETVGFEVMQTLEFDTRKYGGTETGYAYVMVRPAAKAVRDAHVNGVTGGDTNAGLNGSSLH